MPITLVTACNGDVHDKPMLSSRWRGTVARHRQSAPAANQKAEITGHAFRQLGPGLIFLNAINSGAVTAGFVWAISTFYL
jgi:hypothetical protein